MTSGKVPAREPSFQWPVVRASRPGRVGLRFSRPASGHVGGSSSRWHVATAVRSRSSGKRADSPGVGGPGARPVGLHGRFGKTVRLMENVRSFAGVCAAASGGLVAGVVRAARGARFGPGRFASMPRAPPSLSLRAVKKRCRSPQGVPWCVWPCDVLRLEMKGQVGSVEMVGAERAGSGGGQNAVWHAASARRAKQARGPVRRLRRPEGVLKRSFFWKRNPLRGCERLLYSLLRFAPESGCEARTALRVRAENRTCLGRE